MNQPSLPPKPQSVEDNPQPNEPNLLEISPLPDMGDSSVVDALANVFLNSILAMWVPISPNFITSKTLVDRQFCMKGGWKLVKADIANTSSTYSIELKTIKGTTDSKEIRK